MGVISAPPHATPAPRKGIIHPGQQGIARDPATEPYFLALNDELADRGFLVTSADELITWARTGSLGWMTFGLACCAIEMMQVLMPRYDVERFGFAPDRKAHG